MLHSLVCYDKTANNANSIQPMEEDIGYFFLTILAKDQGSPKVYKITLALCIA